MVLLTMIIIYSVNGEPNALQPDPPVIINIDGLEYVLHGTSSVRQGIEPAPPETLNKSTEDTATQVVTESMLDLESGQKETRCEVGF